MPVITIPHSASTIKGYAISLVSGSRIGVIRIIP